MKLTNFMFFKNTPLIDFQNTILFKSNEERDDFFLKNTPYDSLTFSNIQFNFIRDRLTIRLPVSYDTFRGVNYCTFLSDFEPDVRYYAFVIDYKYLNDDVTEVSLLIDGIMTYCQGYVINDFTNLTVERKSMGLGEYNDRIVELKNNDDIIKTHTKKYTHSSQYTFKSLDVLIQCSADLTADFGSVNKPNIETSEGLTFDRVTSPVNLYVVSQHDFKILMKELAPYPWISQNIRSISLIPSILLEGKKSLINMKSTNFSSLYTLKNNDLTNKIKFNSDLLSISKTINQLYSLYALNPEQEKHLLRSEYTTCEVYTYDGQQLFVNNGQLSETFGLHLLAVYTSGYHNEIGVYIGGYKANEIVNGSIVESRDGSFLNDAIFFRNFDDIPILVDNYTLALSKSANQRSLAESKLVTNRVASFSDSGTSSEEKFYNAASLVTNLSPTNLFGKFSDEYEFYRTQQAEFADLALETPTITNQSNNNVLAISEQYFGLHVKYSQPTRKEWDKVRRYYKMFGFMVNDENSSVDIHSNTIADYAKFKGNFIIPNADVAIAEMLKAQFENGVRFWHNNGTRNPMSQNILLNRMR